MSDMILYLPIETKSREFDSKMLIAYYALKKGIDVVIGDKGSCERIADKLGRGAYLHKDHSKLSKALFSKLNDKGIYVYALDEEGLVYLKEEEYYNRLSRETSRLCKGIFLWGNRQMESIGNYLGTEDTRYYITGNPRFDLYQDFYKSYMTALQTKYVDYSGDYVLINTNFSTGNYNMYLYEGTSSYIERMRPRGYIKNNDDEKYYIERTIGFSKLYYEYVELVRAIASAYKKLNFIVRPHPDENHDKWIELTNDLDNVEIIYSESASYWIQRAICVIQAGCTTGIEAWAMKKPVIRYNPITEIVKKLELPNQFGYRADSIEEVQFLIEDIVQNRKGNTFNEQKYIIRNHIHEFNEKFAAEAIVNVIYQDIVSSKDHRFHNRNIVTDIFASKTISDDTLQKRVKTVTKRVLKFFKLLRLVRILKNDKSGSPATTSSPINLRSIKAKAQKFPGISYDEIEFRLNELNKLSNNSQLFEIIRVFDRTAYLIRSK